MVDFKTWPWIRKVREIWAMLMDSVINEVFFLSKHLEENNGKCISIENVFLHNTHNMWYGKTRVPSCELRITSYELKA